MYMFIHLHTRFESYKQVHTIYKHTYARFVQLMFRVQMATYISCHCTDIVEQCTYIDISFLAEVSAAAFLFEFNQHQP
jgi:hypothetical protein